LFEPHFSDDDAPRCNPLSSLFQICIYFSGAQRRRRLPSPAKGQQLPAVASLSTPVSFLGFARRAGERRAAGNGQRLEQTVQGRSVRARCSARSGSNKRVAFVGPFERSLHEGQGWEGGSTCRCRPTHFHSGFPCKCWRYEATSHWVRVCCALNRHQRAHARVFTCSKPPQKMGAYVLCRCCTKAAAIAAHSPPPHTPPPPLRLRAPLTPPPAPVLCF
jgi:hypothetical protein